MTSWLEHGGHEVAVFWVGSHEFVRHRRSS